MRSWASEFKQFLLRGNVIDLAVAVAPAEFLATIVNVVVTLTETVVEPFTATAVPLTVAEVST